MNKIQEIENLAKKILIEVDYVSIPKNFDWNTLQFEDVLIYAYIKKFMNKETNIAQVTFTDISKYSNYTRKRIKSASKRMSDLNLFKIDYTTKPYNYIFPEIEFENENLFTYEFLKLDISNRAKVFFIRMQPFLKNETMKKAVSTMSAIEIGCELYLSNSELNEILDELIEKKMITKN